LLDELPAEVHALIESYVPPSEERGWRDWKGAAVKTAKVAGAVGVVCVAGPPVLAATCAAGSLVGTAAGAAFSVGSTVGGFLGTCAGGSGAAATIGGAVGSVVGGGLAAGTVVGATAFTTVNTVGTRVEIKVLRSVRFEAAIPRRASRGD